MAFDKSSRKAAQSRLGMSSREQLQQGLQMRGASQLSPGTACQQGATGN